ncbi:Protein FAM13A [Acipenser ruthenus]|uniref:Protein FAM13A n=1 Tax=Acipenser ruthenus TaxID=7906 RepID=A0A662YYX4_ACIRT|nr:Protein FAM13A [Acipenser ruthenus]
MINSKTWPESLCLWTVEVPAGKTITVNFPHFEVEEPAPFTKKCFDSLLIYDKAAGIAEKYGPYCGTKLPPAITSKGNKLVMRFNADFFTEAQGFRAYWTTDPTVPPPTEVPPQPNPWDNILIGIHCSNTTPSDLHNTSTVRLKEDMKKIVQQPLIKQKGLGCRKAFDISLLDLQQQGLIHDGIPSLVKSMVEYLMEQGLQQEGLFRVNGNLKVVDELRQRYESREDVDLVQDGDVCSVASLLKLFLRELPDGVITRSDPPVPGQVFFTVHSDDDQLKDLKHLLQQLPDIHYCLLKYLCQFLTHVEKQHKDNRMTVFNLATVFGPNIFHFCSGFEGMKEQDICNKIMAKLIENYRTIFESGEDKEQPTEEISKVITAKAEGNGTDLRDLVYVFQEANFNSPLSVKLSARIATEVLTPAPRKKKITQSKSEGAIKPVPQPGQSVGIPQVKLRISERAHSLEEMERADEMSENIVKSTESLTSLLEKTIRSAVEQHLFDVHGCGGQSSEESESGTSSSTSSVIARQRRRHLRDQDETQRHKDMDDINKENIPSVFSTTEDSIPVSRDGEKKQRDCSTSYIEESMKLKRQVSITKLSELKENKEGLINSAMKIQEVQSGCETAKTQRNQEAGVCEESSVPEVPRLDLSALTEDNNWGDSSFFTLAFIDFKCIGQQSYYEEPVPACPSWQREHMHMEEACLSPQAGGRLIRQLVDEDSDPMLSPRFYAFGQSQQYLDDPEVPPSPPNAHSFMSRRRSASLGSCEDDREELTSAQLSKKIQSLKKKIRKFEEKFEEERKYRPSHSDKAANPELLKWMNELAKLRKQLKEMKVKISEEGLPPQARQRSNTLPKSFGSQLEKQEATEKAPKPTLEDTLEAVQEKLQEKRAEVNRPEDIKDMTREQISAEKVALQKALLYYESIHGRPVTKSERQVMKPLYDRYRLVKQILCRASTIPVIGSPSSKRRSPLLQPIIEGVTASFFEDIKEEEEDGSEDESNAKADFSVTLKPGFRVRNFLDQLDEEGDGFISPVDDKTQSKNTNDMRLSNLHSATMPELVEQLQDAREDKKRLRKKLREFEDAFFRQNARNVQKEERTPMADEYSEYKHVKAKLRLLEVLISKMDSSKTM